MGLIDFIDLTDKEKHDILTVGMSWDGCLRVTDDCYVVINFNIASIDVVIMPKGCLRIWE